jgi:hypothetical protein
MYMSITETVRDRVWSADDMLGYPGINQTLNDTPGVMNTGNIDAVINAAIPYIYKKDILAQRVQ